MEENFKVDGKTYLVRCPKCGRENWAPAVASGVCAWCGYDANKGQGTDVLSKEGGE
jgi:ribosomal protein L37E